MVWIPHQVLVLHCEAKTIDFVGKSGKYSREEGNIKMGLK